MRSELVTKSHLKRRAIVYVRQSTTHQVMNNQESLRLQYALRERAHDLGWGESEVDVKRGPDTNWTRPRSISAKPLILLARPGGIEPPFSP
jgi:hypothetical protein